MENKIKRSVFCWYVNSFIFGFLGIYFFVIPFFQVIYYINDDALKVGTGVPRFASCVHKSLSPKYEKWARGRVESGVAEKLDVEDISGTEWPVFGSVFYLWATDSLQGQWEIAKNGTAPNIYSKGAIEAAAELIGDEGHAAWVKLHWGDGYLKNENVFYRMLLISGWTCYEKLIGDDKYTDMLREQTDSLSKALDESEYGLLDDYPRQCFPTDVVAAIAAINRADKVLGTDHSEFVKRSIRGFTGKLVDWTGLPPYSADSTSGAIGMARGCSSQWIVRWVPELWPDKGREFYASYEKYFWQERYMGVGFREFTKEESNAEWYFDVDSGPVVGGYGAAASAFGVGAARSNGRFDHAYPLSAEFIVASWPLPDGTLLVPRILSNGVHAPYLGEAAVLFNFATMPVAGVEIVKGGDLPGFVYLATGLYLLVGVFIILAALLTLRKSLQKIDKVSVPLEKLQYNIWAGLVILGIIISLTFNLALGVMLLLLSQFLPRTRKIKVKVQVQVQDIANKS